MFFFPGVILRVVGLATLIAIGLMARDHRVASLWRRAMFFSTLAMVPRLGGFDFPLVGPDGWYMEASALASASLLGAVMVQSARALGSGRRLQLGVGIAGAAAALLGSVSYTVM